MKDKLFGADLPRRRFQAADRRLPDQTFFANSFFG